MSLVWWIDRCLGARIVPAALRAHGVDVRTYGQLYPSNDDVADVIWIPEVTRRGWVILTKDREIRRNPAELSVLRAANARYVCLSAKNMTGEQQAECLIQHWRTVESVVIHKPAPLIVAINRGGVQWLDGTDWRVARTKRER